MKSPLFVSPQARELYFSHQFLPPQFAQLFARNLHANHWDVYHEAADQRLIRVSNRWQPGGKFETFKAYARINLKQACIDAHRKLVRKKALLESPDDYITHGNPFSAPDRILISAALCERIEEIISTLPPIEKRAILGFFYEEKTASEIYEDLLDEGIVLSPKGDRNSVNLRRFRALQNIREQQPDLRHYLD